MRGAVCWETTRFRLQGFRVWGSEFGLGMSKHRDLWFGDSDRGNWGFPKFGVPFCGAALAQQSGL